MRHHRAGPGDGRQLVEIRAHVDVAGPDRGQRRGLGFRQPVAMGQCKVRARPPRRLGDHAEQPQPPARDRPERGKDIRRAAEGRWAVRPGRTPDRAHDRADRDGPREIQRRDPLGDRAFGRDPVGRAVADGQAVHPAAVGQRPALRGHQPVRHAPRALRAPDPILALAPVPADIGRRHARVAAQRQRRGQRHTGHACGFGGKTAARLHLVHHRDVGAGAAKRLRAAGRVGAGGAGGVAQQAHEARQPAADPGGVGRAGKGLEPRPLAPRVGRERRGTHEDRLMAARRQLGRERPVDGRVAAIGGHEERDPGHPSGSGGRGVAAGGLWVHA